MNLSDIIKERIRLDGPMTFRSFMQAALYHPGMGYYASPNTSIGRKGDFYTSPQAHPIFGAMLGEQALEAWRILGEPSTFHIIESGGGMGHLCNDMLNYLKDKPAYEGLKYTIIEINPHLEDQQWSLLINHASNVSFAKSLDDICPADKGLIISNELFDAMPVHLIEMRTNPMEVHVSLENNEFTETLGPLSDAAISDYLNEFIKDKLPEGYRTEVNLEMKDWFSSASKVLKEGFVVSIDYGYGAAEYYADERSRGTIMCYYKHQLSENPYENIGGQDITSHVNFSALKRFGDELGFAGIGFARQGAYLVSLGIDKMIAEMRSKNPGGFKRDLMLIKNLIMPGTMGDTHKVLVQYKGQGKPLLRGFMMSNKIGSL